MTEKLKIWSALVHYPVLDKEHNVVTTSVTNMDVHDMARTGKTYELKNFFIVTPIDVQRELVEKVAAMWQEPLRGNRTPSRKAALAIVRVAETIEASSAQIEKETGGKPDIIGTTAKRVSGAISFEGLRKEMASDPDRPRLIIFGTGWGLAPQALDMCSHVLEPVEGINGYNHLSVRNAAAITLDRLLGER